MNKSLLIGRLTKDIELSRTQSGKAFARFTLAVNRRFKSNDGQGQDADFISCVVWDKRAETMYQYLGKGSQVGIEGRIQTGSYERDGQRVYTTDVVVENFDFLETKAQREAIQTQTQPVIADETNYANSVNNEADYNYNYDTEPAPILDIESDDLPF